MLRRAMQQIERPQRRFNATVIVHATPFKASAWTPMAWEGFAMRDYRTALSARRMRSEEGLTAVYTMHIESPGAQVEYGAVTRHDGSKEAREIMGAACHISRFKRAASRAKVEMLYRTWPRYARRMLEERDIDDELPTECATATVSHDTLRKIARKMRSERARSEHDFSWRRGTGTISSRLIA